MGDVKRQEKKRKIEQFEEEEVDQGTYCVGLFETTEFRIGDIPDRGFVERSFDKILLRRNRMIESRVTRSLTTLFWCRCCKYAV
jgi:hypothetical protein